MMVSSAHGTTYAPPVAAVAGAPRATTRDATRDARDTATVSAPAELLSQLSTLQHRDPAQFKQLVQDIASRLHRAASALHGDPALTALAARFAQAAQSGDLSTLAASTPRHRDTAAAPRAGRVDDPAVSSAIAVALSSLKQAAWAASAAVATPVTAAAPSASA